MHFPAHRFAALRGFLQKCLRSGIHYSEGGRSLDTGIDCAGLTIRAMEAVGATLTYDPRDDLGARWYDDPSRGEELLGELEKNFEIHLVPCGDPEPGDLILFRMEPGQPVGHLAWLLDDGSMVHALNEARGVCSCQLETRFWLPRFAGWAAPREEVW